MHDPMQRAPLPKGRGAKPSSNSRAGSPQDTPSLLDHLGTVSAHVTEGQRRRDDGMDAARHAEDVRIVSAAEAEVRRLAASGVEFTADDVMPNLVSRRAIGSVFSRLAREGAIRCVGATASTRPERHHGLTRVWRGGGV